LTGVSTNFSMPASEPEDRPVEEDVLPAGQLGVETRAELDQGDHLAADQDAPAGRPGDLGQQLEDGRLAGPVGADDPEAAALLQLEGDVLERPVARSLGALADQSPGQVGERRGEVALPPDPVDLRDPLEANGEH
jgi:hypothetical protein